MSFDWHSRLAPLWPASASQAACIKSNTGRAFRNQPGLSRRRGRRQRTIGTAPQREKWLKSACTNGFRSDESRANRCGGFHAGSPRPQRAGRSRHLKLRFTGIANSDLICYWRQAGTPQTGRTIAKQAIHSTHSADSTKAAVPEAGREMLQCRALNACSI